MAKWQRRRGEAIDPAEPSSNERQHSSIHSRDLGQIDNIDDAAQQHARVGLSRGMLALEDLKLTRHMFQVPRRRRDARPSHQFGAQVSRLVLHTMDEVLIELHMQELVCPTLRGFRGTGRSRRQSVPGTKRSFCLSSLRPWSKGICELFWSH